MTEIKNLSDFRLKASFESAQMTQEILTKRDEAFMVLAKYDGKEVVMTDDDYNKLNEFHRILYIMGDIDPDVTDYISEKLWADRARRQYANNPEFVIDKYPLNRIEHDVLRRAVKIMERHKDFDISGFGSVLEFTSILSDWITENTSMRNSLDPEEYAEYLIDNGITEEEDIERNGE